MAQAIRDPRIDLIKMRPDRKACISDLCRSGFRTPQQLSFMEPVRHPARRP